MKSMTDRRVADFRARKEKAEAALEEFRASQKLLPDPMVCQWVRDEHAKWIAQDQAARKLFDARPQVKACYVDGVVHNDEYFTSTAAWSFSSSAICATRWLSSSRIVGAKGRATPGGQSPEEVAASRGPLSTHLVSASRTHWRRQLGSWEGRSCSITSYGQVSIVMRLRN